MGFRKDRPGVQIETLLLINLLNGKFSPRNIHNEPTLGPRSAFGMATLSLAKESSGLVTGILKFTPAVWPVRRSVEYTIKFKLFHWHFTGGNGNNRNVCQRDSLCTFTFVYN